MINKSFDINNSQKNFQTISQPITPLHENHSTCENMSKSRYQSIESGEDNHPLANYE